jgi:hypothetical protein
MGDDPSRYPLEWPRGKARTDSYRRKDGNFHTRDSVSGKRDLSIAVALQRLQRELDAIRAEHPVVSSNVELRLDGLPKSNARVPSDPGVALYFHLSIRDQRTGKTVRDPVALACDRYRDVADNIAAIAKHLEASRAIERYGVGTLREIFRGYMALPENATAVDDWRDALGNPTNLLEAESSYRSMMKFAHPDAPGGSEAAAARLNAAIALARQWFGK